MNFKKIIIPLLFLLYFATQCTQQEQSCEKCSKMLTDSLVNQTFKVTKDDFFYYEAEVHGSTGLEVIPEIADTTILIFDKNATSLHYHNKEKMNKGMSGADRATKTFAFKPLQSGTTKLVFRKVFQGELQSQKEFQIQVK